MQTLKESVLVVIGTLLVVVGSAAEQLGRRLGHEVVFEAFALIGFGLIASAIVLAVWRWALTAGCSLLEWLGGTWGSPLTNIPALEIADAVDMPMLREAWSKEFGSAVPSLTQLLEWYLKNPLMFVKVTSSNAVSGSKTIHASAKVLHLKSAAIPMLYAEMISGTTIPADLILTRGRPSAIYVGDVVSSSSWYAHLLVRGLILYVAELATDETAVFSRPIKLAGLKVLKKLGFRPVSGRDDELGHIWVLSGPALASLLDQFQPKPKRAMRRSAVRKWATSLACRKSVAEDAA